MTISALTRSWPTLAAWGAGLIQLGIGAGMVTRGTDAAARGTGVVLVALGAAALVWGVVSLARGRVIAPGVGVGLALAGVVAAVVAMSVDPVRISLHATGVSVVLWLVCGVAAAAIARRSSRRSSAAAPDGAAAADPDGARAANARTVPRTSAVGILVGSIIVAGLVTPALGATEAGGLAPSHSDHPMFVDHGH